MKDGPSIARVAVLIGDPARAGLAQGVHRYDPLAGELAVVAYESLLARCVFGSDAEGLHLTHAGAEWFVSLGIDTAAAAAQRRALCRSCLDWSERRPHLGGALGTALLKRMVELGWARRAKDSRVISFTPTGEQDFLALFPIS